MIVKCPSCEKQFRLDDDKISPEGTWVRCSACGDVFQVFPEGQAPPPEPEDLDEEEYTFDLGGGDSDDGYSASLDDEGDELDLDAELGGGGKGRGGAFKVLFWLVALLIILLALGLGGLLVMDRMGWGVTYTEQARQLPVVGPLVGQLLGQAPPPAGDHPLAEPGEFELSKVRGYFRVNEHQGQLFVIQGKVNNNGQKVRTDVLVRGRLQDAQMNVLRQAVVYAGPVFTPEELRQLTIKEMQARLGMPTAPDGSGYVVAPGSALPFMVVFADVPDNVSEFTAEVLASKVPSAGTGGG